MRRRVKQGLFCIGVALFLAAIQGIGIDTSQAETRLEPALVEKVQPVYPQELKRHNIEGVVKATYTIDTDGRVIAVETVTDSHSAFRQAVETALAQWRFEPPLMHGTAIRLQRLLEVRFERPDDESIDGGPGGLQPFPEIARNCIPCPCKKEQAFTT
jgi:TonB family protein